MQTGCSFDTGDIFRGFVLLKNVRRWETVIDICFLVRYCVEVSAAGSPRGVGASWILDSRPTVLEGFTYISDVFVPGYQATTGSPHPLTSSYGDFASWVIGFCFLRGPTRGTQMLIKNGLVVFLIFFDFFFFFLNTV